MFAILENFGLQAGRFRLLLATLILYCVGNAIVPRWSNESAASLGIVLLIATIVELKGEERRSVRNTIFIVAGLGIVARIAGAFVGGAELPLISNLLDVIFAAGLTYAVHSAVMQPHRRAGDRVVGAICVYLLIGFAWAAIYSTIETAAPGSFRSPADLPTDDTSVAFVYYSFVTLSTLGYGDITPVTRLAGTLAWMEAILGQLYIAITVASLISLTLAERRSPGDS